DVPFLQARFPEMIFPETHLDLRYILYRLGQAGGLKRIEERLGVVRGADVKGVDGLEAVRLWHAHRAGRAGALERLVLYNRADTVNLEPLLAYATRELTKRTLGAAPAPSTPGLPL
ncbi:MAG: ribonuclease H-like domain-containing protein, partial [Thermoplasmata archaeon]|nr:ribonuclease H-like domain-containing protein [Thermoplasmata archaeon]